MAKAKVRYKGASDVRVLPADQLKEHGVKGIDKDLVFQPSNGWAQEVEMSEELEGILRGDGAFSITPVDDSGEADETNPEVEATKVDDTGETVVDGDTGQAEENKHQLAESGEDEKAPLASETGSTTGPDTNVATGH